MYKVYQMLGVAMASIPTKTLNNGVKIPMLSVGTAGSNLTKVYDELNIAIDAEVFHFDTAHDYCSDGTAGLCTDGSNQPAIAKVIKDSQYERGDFFITTKIPGCGRFDIGNDTCAEDTLAVAQKNLDELETDYVDLLLLHQPDQAGNCDHIRTQWSTLQTLVKANKTRAIGVSNYCKSSFECLFEDDLADDFIVPAVNQIYYHVGMGPNPDGIHMYMEYYQIQLQAYSPLGMRYHNQTDLINGPLVTEIGNNHNKSGPSVALRWVIQTDGILSTQSDNPKHLQENIDIFDWKLTDDEMERLSAATRPYGVPSYMCSDREGKSKEFIQ